MVLATIAFVALALLPFGAKQFGDSDVHINARTLAGAVRGEVPWREVGVNRLPFTTLYYGLPYLAIPTGSSEQVYWKAAFIWNFIGVTGSLLLLRRAAVAIGGDGSGDLAVWLALLSPFAIYYALAISAEAPAWIMATVMLYGWARWQRSAKFGALVLFTLGLSGTILSRPNAVLVLACAFVCGLLLWRRQRSQAVLALVASTSALLISILAGAVASSLPHPAGERSGLENFAYVAFHGSFQYRDEPLDWRGWDDETRSGSSDYALWVNTRRTLETTSEQTGESLTSLQLRWILNDYLEHMPLRLRMALTRAGALHVGMTNAMTPNQFHLGPLRGFLGWVLFHVAANASTFVAIPSAVWFLISQRRRFLELWPAWGPWLSLTVFHALIYGEARYLVPARPGLMLLAGCGLACLLRRVKASRSVVASRSEVASPTSGRFIGPS